MEMEVRVATITVEERGDAQSGWTKCLIAGMEVLCDDAAFAGDPYVAIHLTGSGRT
jgi:hypothetical protein